MQAMGMIRTVVVSLGLLLAFSPLANAGQGEAAPGKPAMKQGSQKTAADILAGRVQSISKQYNLNEEQQAKLKPILEEEMAKMKELQDKENISRREIRKASQEKFKAILTPEQLKKMDEIRQKAEAGRGANHGPKAATAPK